MYLTTPRLLSLLGLINLNSPTYKIIFNYITIEFSDLYQDIVDLVVGSESQQYYIFKNLIDFFGKPGVNKLLCILATNDFDVDKQLKKWDIICKKMELVTLILSS